MLGCYVGPVGMAARGVPERFLDAKADSRTSKDLDGQIGPDRVPGERVNGEGKEGGTGPGPGTVDNDR